MSFEPDEASDPQDSPDRRARRFFSLAVIFEGGMGVAAWLVGRLTGHDALRVQNWRWTDLPWGLVATVPMIGVFAVCLKSEWGPLRRIREFLEEQIRPVLAGSRWYALALVALAAGFGEEALFRGLIQGSLARAAGTVPAVVLASLIFGLSHPITRAYIVIAGLLGLYLGGIFAWTGSLLLVSVAHATYDFIALVWFVNRPPDREPHRGGADSEGAGQGGELEADDRASPPFPGNGDSPGAGHP